MSGLDFNIKFVELGIFNFRNKFLESPFSCYTESEMHCVLYNELKIIGDGKHNVKIGIYDKPIQTGLLHNEYPTLGYYYKSADKPKLLVSYNKNKEVNKKQKFRPTRGHFDLAIIDPDETKYFKWQRTSIAIELSLNEDSLDLKHLHNDYTKLTDKNNNIDQGYLIYLIRTEELSKTRQNRLPELRKAIKEFGKKLDHKIKLLYLEAPQSSKETEIMFPNNWLQKWATK